MTQLTACRLTAPIPSAIATISIHGDGADELVNKLVGKRSTDAWQIGRVQLLMWPISNDSQEHVVACRVDAQTVELHCHGGQAVIQCILDQLQFSGCGLVDADRYDRVLMGDEPEAEAIIDYVCRQALLTCNSERAVGHLLDQADGRLYQSLRQLAKLAEHASYEELQQCVTGLEVWFEFGSHLIKPWQVVLAGPPNVGKSSLINSLAGQAIAIVHEQAGTTRDWIDAAVIIDGWSVSITDTAGMRATADGIEQEGVRRAAQKIKEADLVVVVVDLIQGWTEQHDAIIELCTQREFAARILICGNKADLVAPTGHSPAIVGLPADLKSHDCVYCSAQGSVEPLLEQISKILVPRVPDHGQAIVFNRRQQEILRQMLALLGQIPVDGRAVDQLKLLAQQLFQLE
jgi:tRNA modification GTPase